MELFRKFVRKNGDQLHAKPPPYYIAFVVYHEMLHAALGISETDGRRSIHSKEFRRREKLFRDYEKAIAWECRDI